MASARRLSWLALSFGALAVIGTLAAGAVAGSRVDLSLPAAQSLLAACKQLVPSVAPADVVVLAVLVLAGAVLVRAARAAARQLVAQRRLLRHLDVLAVAEVGSVRFEVIAGSAPQAFCGGLLSPRVFVSRGALDALDDRELEAVLAHEDHHRQRYDPLRLAAGATLADAFFFVPALRRLDERYRAVAELAADEAAVRRSDASTLASALLRFAPAERSAAVGIAPERVDHLLGERAAWDLPVVLLLASVIALGLLVAAAMSAAATGAMVNVPTTVMSSCMVLMSLAAVGAVVGAIVSIRRRA